MARASLHHLVRAVSLWGDTSETVGVFSSAAEAQAAARERLDPAGSPAPVRMEIEQWRGTERVAHTSLTIADLETSGP